MGEVVLLSRRKAGYDTDRFFFEYKGKKIARFYGIVIKMFFRPKGHEPSHIHALYGEYLGEFNIRTMEMIQGDLPRKAQELVREWLASHQEEWRGVWDNQQIRKVPPLKKGVYI